MASENYGSIPTREGKEAEASLRGDSLPDSFRPTYGKAIFALLFVGSIGLLGSKYGTLARQTTPSNALNELVVPDTDKCYTCDPGMNPCSFEMGDRVFHFEHCSAWDWFVQCSQWGTCHEMPCAPGTAWNQDYGTCCHIQDDRLRCCKDGVCEMIPPITPTAAPSESGLGNRGPECELGNGPPGSKTTYFPMVDTWPPPYDTSADYWCSASEECDDCACCGVWANLWHVCIPKSDAIAMGNVCPDLAISLP